MNNDFNSLQYLIRYFKRIKLTAVKFLFSTRFTSSSTWTSTRTSGLSSVETVRPPSQRPRADVTTRRPAPEAKDSESSNKVCNLGVVWNGDNLSVVVNDDNLSVVVNDGNLVVAVNIDNVRQFKMSDESWRAAPTKSKCSLICSYNCKVFKIVLFKVWIYLLKCNWIEYVWYFVSY